MSLTQADVEKIALLARLQLSPGETDALTRELGRIVQYVELLNELPTDDVLPLAHAMDLSNVFAEDEPGASLDREQALANAPKRDEECYRVPAVLGDD